MKKLEKTCKKHAADFITLTMSKFKNNADAARALMEFKKVSIGNVKHSAQCEFHLGDLLVLTTKNELIARQLSNEMHEELNTSEFLYFCGECHINAVDTCMTKEM